MDEWMDGHTSFYTGEGYNSLKPSGLSVAFTL